MWPKIEFPYSSLKVGLRPNLSRRIVAYLLAYFDEQVNTMPRVYLVIVNLLNINKYDLVHRSTA